MAFKMIEILKKINLKAISFLKKKIFDERAKEIKVFPSTKQNTVPIVMFVFFSTGITR